MKLRCIQKVLFFSWPQLNQSKPMVPFFCTHLTDKTYQNSYFVFSQTQSIEVWIFFFFGEGLFSAFFELDGFTKTDRRTDELIVSKPECSTLEYFPIFQIATLISVACRAFDRHTIEMKTGINPSWRIWLNLMQAIFNFKKLGASTSPVAWPSHMTKSICLSWTENLNWVFR